MTDQQLYVAVGIPTLAVLIGILMNIGQIIANNSRIGSIENRTSRLENRFERLEDRFASFEGKFDTKMDLLVGKVIDFDNRIIRLEERLKH